MIKNKPILSLLIAIAMLSLSCGSPSRSNSNHTASVPPKASPQPPPREMTTAEALVAAKEILKSGRTDDEIHNIRGSLARIVRETPEHKEAQQLLVKIDARIMQIKLEREAPQMARQTSERARQTSETETTRKWLLEDFRKTIAQANPYLNFIGSKITKINQGYALWAVHSYFNKYSFKAGDNAHIVRQWIEQWRTLLSKADIYRVGLMDEDKWGGSCWYDL